MFRKRMELSDASQSSAGYWKNLSSSDWSARAKQAPATQSMPRCITTCKLPERHLWLPACLDTGTSLKLSN